MYKHNIRLHWEYLKNIHILVYAYFRYSAISNFFMKTLSLILFLFIFIMRTDFTETWRLVWKHKYLLDIHADHRNELMIHWFIFSLIHIIWISLLSYYWSIKTYVYRKPLHFQTVTNQWESFDTQTQNTTFFSCVFDII